MKNHAIARLAAPLAMAIAATPALAQDEDTPRPVMEFPADTQFKQSFDTTYGEAGKANRALQAAKFVYTMLEEDGVPRETIKVAVVVHGTAIFDFFTDEKYREKYGDIDNPNAERLAEFLDMGGQVWISGGGLEFRGYTPDDLLPGVGIAPAALIAHAELNRQGYSVNPYTVDGPSLSGRRPQYSPLPGGLPLSSAVRVEDILYLSGDLGIAREGRGFVPGGIGPETQRTMERIGETLAKHGLDYGDIFKCTVFLADMAEWRTFNEIYKTFFEDGKYPARSALGVGGLAGNARVEVECLAWAGG